MRTTLIAIALLVTACAHGNSATEEEVSPNEEEGPPGSFDLECRFGISGCERQAASRCHTGYHVIKTYKTGGFAGTPYWYMKAICKPGENTGQ
jgi:hypothetical protein